MSQLYKIPVFISHFIEHDKGGEFFDEMKYFIVHHYGGHEVDEDWETDQKLPFVKIEMAHFDQITIPFFEIQFSELKREIHQDSIVFFNDKEFFDYYLNSIWQPPKQA